MTDQTLSKALATLRHPSSGANVEHVEKLLAQYRRGIILRTELLAQLWEVGAEAGLDI